ncbi:uncharacterized protein LOC121391609 [Gigantopelta aegis]|uniref:uncharacterized protein LOC121391609 n=1 Tax=Gigantopelta aegis TaxID=1735272 RepID=UPI001B887A71|nr:uncharacterized protein LOC121391609 [Gigantopelta aegis]
MHSHFEIVSENESDSEDGVCIDALFKNQTRNEDWKIEVEINEDLVQLKLDIGAQCSVISKDFYKSLGGRQLHKSRVKLISYSGHKLQPMGKTILSVGYKSQFYTLEFQVVDADVVPILGLQACTELNLIKKKFTVFDDVQNKENSDVPNYKEIVNGSKELFHGLGKIKGVKHHIVINQDAKPVVHPPRKIPFTL